MEETLNEPDQPGPQQDTTESRVPRRIRGHRSIDDRYVAGVFGGLGEQFNVDPTILRLITVAAAVTIRNDAPALIPILYFIAWVTIPPYGGRSLLGAITQPSSLQEVGGAAIATVLASFAADNPRLLFAGFLAAIAWILLSDGGRNADSPEQPSAPTADSQGSTMVAPSGDESEQPPPRKVTGKNRAAVTAAAWGRARRGLRKPLEALQVRPVRKRPPRREPALWPLPVGLLVAFGIACLAIESATDPGLHPAIAINGALLIIGGVLILSSWRGRAGWPSLLIIPLIPLWIAFSATDIGRFEGEGRRSILISEQAEGGELAYEHGYGSLHIDVTKDALPEGETLRLTTEMTAGETTIVVPHNTPITVRSRTGLGQVSVEGTGYLWETDVNTMVSRNRTSTYAVPERECIVNTFTAEELEESYRHWVSYQSEGASALLDEVPDFNDPDTQHLSEVTRFFADHLPPNLTPEVDATGTTWTSSFDPRAAGDQPCDPSEAPRGTGAIEINATIGLGGLQIVRSY